MKRKICMIVCLLAVILTLANLAYIVKDSFFYSLENLPTGTLVREDFDQNILFRSGYKLRVYEVSGNRHFADGVRVEMCNDITGEQRTIYWQTDTKGSIINWNSDSDTDVTINGVHLDFSKESYDCRDYYNHNVGIIAE